MAVSKVVMNTENGKNVLVDLTADTITADKMLSGTTAHNKSGEKITGTIATRTATNMTVSGASVTAPAGYYASAQSKSVSTATQATPSISLSADGLITASATQSAGYVSAGTKTATKQLSGQGAQTIVPTTADQSIASGKYLTGTQTIKGDANLVPGNIKNGVSIFGVAGTYEGSGSGGSQLPGMYIQNSTGTIIVYGTVSLRDGDKAFVLFDSSQDIGAGPGIVYMTFCVLNGTYKQGAKITDINGNAFTDYGNASTGDLRFIVIDLSSVKPDDTIIIANRE